jgi:hypothetical protein
MKIGRNQLCPCGSGKKYKYCHYGKPFRASTSELSLHQRNMILLLAAADIFGFSKGRDWSDFKRNLSGSQIRKFYEVQADLCRPGSVDWAKLMPAPDGRLRALYLGDIYPEMIANNILRFSLYSDQLLVVDPFHNPWCRAPKYNPIENPDQFKSDTIKLVYFLFQIAPWIEAGIVSLIPDPSDLERFPFRLTISRICEVCSAFSTRDFIETSGDGPAQALEGVGGPLQGVGSDFAEDGFELGECLLDRVEVGTVCGKVDRDCTAPFDGFSHAGDFVHRDIVHEHDVTSFQGRNENLLDIGPERLAVHRAFEHEGRGHMVVAQRRDEGGCLPVAMWHLVD